MKNGILSVIIPTLNEELYLPVLLNDFKKQKDKNFEIIVVDGKSEDKTREIAERYTTSLKITVIVSEHRNLSLQRNLGASHAQGEFIIFLDADSRVNPTFLSSFRNEVNKNKYLIYLPTIIPQGNNPTDIFIFQLSSFLVEVSQMFGNPLPTGSAMIFNRHYFEYLGGYTHKPPGANFFPEDHDIIMRAHHNGVKAKYLKNVRVKFSLRRINKEGRLSVYRKYLISAFQTVAKGKVDGEMFEYDMGGHVYKLDNKSPHGQKEFIDNIKDIFKNIV